MSTSQQTANSALQVRQSALKRPDNQVFSDGDDTTELKGGMMSINDSMFSKQTKNLKMKMNVKLDKAKENAQKRLGVSSSMPSLHPINDSILTQRYQSTQIQNTFADNVDKIKNFGIAPSLPPPQYANPKSPRPDQILFINLTPQRNIQLLKVPLDLNEQQESPEMVQTSKAQKTSSISQVVFQPSTQTLLFLRKHDFMWVEDINIYSTKWHGLEEYRTREDYLGSLTVTELDNDQFKDRYDWARQQQAKS